MAKPLNIVVCGSLVPDPLQTLEPVQTPQGPGLKNEQMLPSVLDPWAACALYEAAALAKARPGSKVTLVALGPKAKLQQLMMTVAQKVPLELVAVNASAGGFTDAKDTALELAKAIKTMPVAPDFVFGGCASASRDAGVTLQLVAESLGITEFFNAVDEIKVNDDDTFSVKERIEGGKYLSSICSGFPAAIGWATGNWLGYGQFARTAKQSADRHDEHARHHAGAHEGSARQCRYGRHRVAEGGDAGRQA